MSKLTRPTFHAERALMKRGFKVIAGLDEAGCGALAGPVVASAVVLPLNSRIAALNDSKKMTARARERVYELVIARARAWAVGIVDHTEIDTIGIRPATFLAMQRALEQIQGVDALLVDAWTLPNVSYYQEGIVRGDAKVKSIAAASVVAKVTRDRLMHEYASVFPLYGFDRHKGYATKTHREAIKEHGPCAVHRKSFAPCRLII